MTNRFHRKMVTMMSPQGRLPQLTSDKLSKIGPEKPAEIQEKSPMHQAICFISHPLTHWKKEIKATDVKTRKVLSKLRHPEIVCQADEGLIWGLMSVKVSIQGITAKNQEYIRKMAPKEELLSDCNRQQKSQE